ncbi:hypothetical protein JHK85_010290 [Glycine max]|nr:hypothetical protein JHK85_010290 [Glycine max]
MAISYAISKCKAYKTLPNILTGESQSLDLNIIVAIIGTGLGPEKGSFTSTGLVVSSKLPRFSDMYTLTIASTDPKSISTNEQYISPKVSLSGIFLSVLSLHPLTYVCSHDDIGHMNQHRVHAVSMLETPLTGGRGSSVLPSHDHVGEGRSHELVNDNKHQQHKFKIKHVQVVSAKEDGGFICVMGITKIGFLWYVGVESRDHFEGLWDMVLSCIGPNG